MYPKNYVRLSKTSQIEFNLIHKAIHIFDLCKSSSSVQVNHDKECLLTIKRETLILRVVILSFVKQNFQFASNIVEFSDLLFSRLVE